LVDRDRAQEIQGFIMKVVIRSAAALTAALAVAFTVSPASAAPSAVPSAATTSGWCLRADPGTNGPCPILMTPSFS
jgi:hypothetical protein